MSQALMFSAYSNPMIVVDAADFDGTSDYMTRASGMTGAADSKSGIVSAWVRLDGGDSANGYLLAANTATDNHFRVIRSSANILSVVCDNTADTQILVLNTLNTYLAGATWLNILASWDLSTPGASHLYINDVSDKSVVSFTDDTIDYTVTEWLVGSLTAGSNKLNGCLAELYFAPGQYLDFSLVSNRRKFISASGKPVHLGTNGALPTGISPIVYQHLADAEAVANFATNLGTGGDFSITGTLDTCSTSPSD